MCDATLAFLGGSLQRCWPDSGAAAPSPKGSHPRSRSVALQLGLTGYFDIVDEPMNLTWIEEKVGTFQGWDHATKNSEPIPPTFSIFAAFVRWLPPLTGAWPSL